MQEVRRKYGCLRAIGIVILLLAWVVLFLGLAGAVLSWLATPRMFSGIQLAMLQVGTGISLVLALTLFFQWFVLGSVLTLMTDLEHNTRRNAEAVSRLVALAEAPEKVGAALPTAVAAPVAAAPVPPPPPVLVSGAAALPAAVVAGTAAVTADKDLAAGPLPPPPPLAPSIVAEVEAAAADAGSGVQDVAKGAGDAATDMAAEAADAIAGQVEPIEPTG